jgi:hypothetical protein
MLHPTYLHFFRYASDELRGDASFVLQVIQSEWELASDFSAVTDSLRGDKTFVLQAFECNNRILRYIHKSLREDKEFIFSILQSSRSSYLLEMVSKGLRADKEFMLKAVKIDRMSFDYASEALINDKKFVLEAIKLGAHVFFPIGVDENSNIEDLQTPVFEIAQDFEAEFAGVDVG